MPEKLINVETGREFFQNLLCALDLSGMSAARNRNTEERSPGLTPIDSPSPPSPLSDRYEPDSTTSRLPVQDEEDEEDEDDTSKKGPSSKKNKR
jgi:hypothetical protein